jgi:hypothetical protein
VVHNGNGFDIRKQFAQQCESLADNRNIKKTHPGDVAARPTQTGNKPRHDRIGPGHENDRNTCRGGLCRGGSLDATNNRRDRKGNKLRSQFRQSLWSTVSPARFNCNFVARIARFT